LAFLGVAAAAGCSQEYQFVPDPVPDPLPEAGGPRPPSTQTACSDDAECAELVATGICDSRSGYCAECEPAREQELNRCADGLYCDTNGRCALGCDADTDCRGLTCDLERRACVGCTEDAECAPGTMCAGAVCTGACEQNSDCPYGWSCCGGACRNTLTDVASCGACGLACEAGGECWNGVCGNGRCPDGFAECDGEASNGCETATVANPENCGRCRVACASNFCSGGVCTTMGCPQGFADCNQREGDQCEASLGSVENCVMCGRRCSDVNGEPACNPDGCAIDCDDDYEDCDGDVDTGCETHTADDVDHCGDCDTVCTNQHGTTRCNEGECQPRCAQGFEDCDGDASNGCETNTESSLANCGGCGDVCRPSNATGACEDGVCVSDCEAGFADCDGSAENGCEVDLASPETCGSCSQRCSDAGGTPSCDDGVCSIVCDASHQDCLNGPVDGCETNVDISPTNCGVCGNVCASSVGIPECSNGVCGISTCSDPNRECDPSNPTRCDTNISNNEQHCGACGNVCDPPNATGECVNRVCSLEECDEGFADCDEGGDGSVLNGCEVRLGSVAHCRTCAESCVNEHGTTECTGSGCAPSCANGWGDCDGNKANGCETQLNTLFNCGACGTSCNKAHGSESCTSGRCEIVACDRDWEDCDPENETQSRNGCETPLNTLTNCGGCGVACALAGGGESCATGQCVLTGCDANRADCSSQAGCETTLGTTANCLDCGDTCTNAHGNNTCIPLGMPNAGCAPACDPGWKSCDGDRGNGCERNIRTLTDCGDCGVTCSLPNATASCSTGTCTMQACNTSGGPANAGYLDCNSGAGCETPKGTTSNCRTCNESCTNAHGTSACNVASGCTFTCSPASQWGNCDSNASNGCEASLTTLANCGSCGAGCDLPGSGESCATGSCVVTTCTAGFENCDATNPDCETPLGTATNCNGCGNTCTNAHGQNGCTGSGSDFNCSPSCDAGWKSCDGEPDNGCERNIRTLTDCGDCNQACSLANATATCAAGTCSVASCNAGFQDCTSAAGCETQLGTVSNCAGCGDSCTNSHGGNACTGTPGNYACTPTCDTGWRSCDNDPDNGCETQLNSLAHCGNCNTPCDLPNASESCASGSCTLTGCNAGFVDCTTGPGCETQLGTTGACAACGNACTNAHGTTSCTGAPGSYDCAPSCEAGWRSCDNNPDNGCERSIRTLTDCNGCGVACSFPNAAASCATGTCTLGGCNAGFGDCNASPGCETQLGTDANCSACGNACTNSHGTNRCSGSAGSYDCAPTCSAGFGNCDGNPDNGCEADLTTPAACGACGNVCGGATPDCVVAAGVYQCQSRIAYVNDVEATSGGSFSAPQALSMTHNLQAGSNRIVLAAIVAGSINSTGVNGARPEVVTYAGTAMTQAGAYGPPDAYTRPNLFYYYLTDTGTNRLPASTGNQPVVIDGVTQGNNDPFIVMANVIEFTGVQQTAPITLGSGQTFSFPGSNCAASNNVTPSITGSVLYSLSAAHFSGTNAVTTPSGFTLAGSTGNVGDQMRAFAAYRGTASLLNAGTAYPTGFTYPWCSPAVHFPIVLLPVRVP
jgi:hypothetical protein